MNYEMIDIDHSSKLEQQNYDYDYDDDNVLVSNNNCINQQQNIDLNPLKQGKNLLFIG